MAFNMMRFVGLMVLAMSYLFFHQIGASELSPASQKKLDDKVRYIVNYIKCTDGSLTEILGWETARKEVYFDDGIATTFTEIETQYNRTQLLLNTTKSLNLTSEFLYTTRLKINNIYNVSNKYIREYRSKLELLDQETPSPRITRNRPPCNQYVKLQDRYYAILIKFILIDLRYMATLTAGYKDQQYLNFSENLTETLGRQHEDRMRRSIGDITFIKYGAPKSFSHCDDEQLYSDVTKMTGIINNLVEYYESGNVYGLLSMP